MLIQHLSIILLQDLCLVILFQQPGGLGSPTGTSAHQQAGVATPCEDMGTKEIAASPTAIPPTSDL